LELQTKSPKNKVRHFTLKSRAKKALKIQQPAASPTFACAYPKKTSTGREFFCLDTRLFPLYDRPKNE